MKRLWIFAISLSLLLPQTLPAQETAPHPVRENPRNSGMSSAASKTLGVLSGAGAGMTIGLGLSFAIFVISARMSVAGGSLVGMVLTTAGFTVGVVQGWKHLAEKLRTGQVNTTGSVLVDVSAGIAAGAVLGIPVAIWTNIEWPWMLLAGGALGLLLRPTARAREWSHPPSAVTRRLSMTEWIRHMADAGTTGER